MASIIAPSRAKSIAELQLHHGLGTPCGRARGETQVSRTRQGRSIEGPNTYPELRSRVAACAGEKMIQQSHVPMDIGEVEGEIEGSDDQIDELSGARKPQRDERSTHQRGPGNRKEARSRQRA